MSYFKVINQEGIVIDCIKARTKINAYLDAYLDHVFTANHVKQVVRISKQEYDKWDGWIAGDYNE